MNNELTNSDIMSIKGWLRFEYGESEELARIVETKPERIYVEVCDIDTESIVKLMRKGFHTSIFPNMFSDPEKRIKLIISKY